MSLQQLSAPHLLSASRLYTLMNRITLVPFAFFPLLAKGTLGKGVWLAYRDGGGLNCNKGHTGHKKTAHLWTVFCACVFFFSGVPLATEKRGVFSYPVRGER